MASDSTSSFTTGYRTHIVERVAGLMLLLTILSWLGEYIHNLYELPNLTLLSPENSIPALISLVLFLVWWLTPFERAAPLLLAWGSLHLSGSDRSGGCGRSK